MKKNLANYGFIFSLVLSLTVLFIFGCRKEQQPPPQAPAAAAPATVPPAPATNPAQVQPGMTGAQVQQLMGTPSKIEQEGSVVEWKFQTPQGKVEIKLQNDKVIAVERH